MWERITKKEFINELSNKENALLGSWMNLKEDSPMTTKLVNTLFEFDKQPTCMRKPYKIQSNAIQFDNDSWLYFNDISKVTIEKWSPIAKSIKENPQKS